MKIHFNVFLCFILQAGLALPLVAQDPLRLESDVNEITARDKSINKKDIILFTGSSSIRIWDDIQSYFPGHNIVNTGFGGSETSDLLYYFNKLILPYKPKQIFIYEGDNDLNSGKSSSQILATSDSLLRLIREHVSEKVQVFFISPKPSLARWQLKERYEQYNRELKKWVARQKNVTFIDVWTPSLDQQGKVFQDIFLEDGLHMNKKGYVIWAREIGKFVH